MATIDSSGSGPCIDYSFDMECLYDTTQFELNVLLNNRDPGPLSITDLSVEAADDIERRLEGIPTTFEIRKSDLSANNREVWQVGKHERFAAFAVGRHLEVAAVQLELPDAQSIEGLGEIKNLDEIAYAHEVARLIVQKLAETPNSVDWPEVLSKTPYYARFVLFEGMKVRAATHTIVPYGTVINGHGARLLHKISPFSSKDRFKYLYVARDSND